MSSAAMQMAVAEAIGVKTHERHAFQPLMPKMGTVIAYCVRCGRSYDYVGVKVPDDEPCSGTKHMFCSSHDAMHVAVTRLSPEERAQYVRNLLRFCPSDATPERLADCLLKLTPREHAAAFLAAKGICRLA